MKPRAKRRIERLTEQLHLRETKEIILALLAVILLLLFGTLGYEFIEGWDYFDSLYMTVITVATVGFSEVHPLHPAGQAFTMLLIFIGVGVATVGIGIIGKRIFERQLVWLFETKKMQEKIDRLDEHTILCGYGRLTRVAARKLQEAGEKIVIIEKDDKRHDEAIRNGYLVVKGDAALDETLLRAGIQRAKRIVCLLPKDAENLYVILTSREANPSLFIMSRAEDEAGEKRLKRAGADRIISPYRIGGIKIAEGLLRPYVTDFLDLAVSGAHHEGLQIEEIRIPENSPVVGQTLEIAELRKKTNIIVAAIISKEGEMQFNPSGTAIIEPGATFIGLGYRKDFATLEAIFLG